ncbi:MAG TPA: hypothetical protein VGK93_02675 [Candidatus Eisenbacteria bacterium]|jgi:hypothetical protein
MPGVRSGASGWADNAPTRPFRGSPAVVVLGCGVALVASAAWLAFAWRSRHRASALDWFRTGASILLGIALAMLWFRG